jgi:hypothetical protein
VILLETQQILAAVERSLETHILPQLEDDFARVQVAAALKALQEVRDRLRDGDPLDAMNAAVIDGARTIVANHAETSAEFVGRLKSVLDGFDASAVPRDLNRQIGADLWPLVSRNQDPAALALMDILRAQAQAANGADIRYMSLEAIKSLT